MQQTCLFESLTGNLVARGDDDVRTRIDELTMRLTDECGILQECSCSPQWMGHVDAMPFKLRRKTAVDHKGSVKEE